MAFLHRGNSGNSNIGQIRSLLGPSTTTAASIQALGSMPTTWWNACLLYAEGFWNWDLGDYTGVRTHAGSAQGATGGQYYDRASYFYQLYALTGDPKWKTRADAYVVDLVNNYFGVSGYFGGFYLQWVNPRSLVVYDLLNGGTFGKTALGKLADGVATGAYGTEIHAVRSASSLDVDSRQFARAIQLLTWAVYSGSTSATNPSGFSSYLTTRLTDVLAWQDADGGVRNPAEEWKNKAFMLGMMCDAFIDYLRLIGPDSRINAFIKKAADYMIADNYVQPVGAFMYLDGDNVAAEQTIPAAELNGFWYPVLWWLGKDQGEASASGYYTAFGDRMFVEAVNFNYPFSNGMGTYPIVGFGGGKQTNEQYHSVFHYFDYRAQVTSSAVPTTSINRNQVAFPETPVQVVSQGASGDSLHPGTAYRWTANGAGSVVNLGECFSPIKDGKYSVEVYCKKAVSGGLAAFYIYADNGSGVTTLAPTLVTPTTSYSKVGVYDVVLMQSNVANNTASLKATDSNGGTSFSGTLDIVQVYIGIGPGGEYFPPQVPMLGWTSNNNPAPILSGTATVGNTLTIAHGTYSIAPTSYLYKWYRDGLEITSATSQTYVPVSADSGHKICGSEAGVNAVGTGTWCQAMAVAVP